MGGDEVNEGLTSMSADHQLLLHGVGGQQATESAAPHSGCHVMNNLDQTTARVAC